MHPALRDLRRLLGQHDFEEWCARWTQECHSSVDVDRYTFDHTKDVAGYREMLRGQCAKEIGLFVMAKDGGRGVETEQADNDRVSFRSSVMVLRSCPNAPETMTDRRPVLDGSVPPRPPLAWVRVSDNTDERGRLEEDNMFAMDEVETVFNGLKAAPLFKKWKFPKPLFLHALRLIVQAQNNGRRDETREHEVFHRWASHYGLERMRALFATMPRDAGAEGGRP